MSIKLILRLYKKIQQYNLELILERRDLKNKVNYV